MAVDLYLSTTEHWSFFSFNFYGRNVFKNQVESLVEQKCNSTFTFLKNSVFLIV